MKRIAWLALISFALATTSQAASFDCSKAGAQVEKLICSSKTLSKWDDELEIAYKKVLNRTTEEFKKKYLISEQRDWIKNIRDGCQDEECLSDAYSLRVLYFRGVNGGLEDINSPDRFELVTNPERAATVISDFQKDLSRVGIEGLIKRCPIILAAPYYRATVYGVVCYIGDKNRTYPLLMCDDTMVGNFTLKQSFSIAIDAIKDFAKKNCFGGA